MWGWRGGWGCTRKGRRRWHPWHGGCTSSSPKPSGGLGSSPLVTAVATEGSNPGLAVGRGVGVLAEGEEPVLGVFQTAVLVVEGSGSGVLSGKPQRNLASGAATHNLGGRVDPQAVANQVSEKGSVGGGRDFCRPRSEDQDLGWLTVVGSLLGWVARAVGLFPLLPLPGPLLLLLLLARYVLLLWWAVLV